MYMLYTWLCEHGSLHATLHVAELFANQKTKPQTVSPLTGYFVLSFP